MSIASLNMVSEDMKTSVIRILSYQDKNPVGTFFNLFYGKEIAFGNLTKLLLLMEDMMDSMDNPRASVQSRQFRDVPRSLERVSIEEQLLLRPNQEAIATFKVKVLFRRGASWQGMLTWVEQKQEVPFRSTLELIKLIDSALSQPESCYQTTISVAADAG